MDSSKDEGRNGRRRRPEKAYTYILVSSLSPSSSKRRKQPFVFATFEEIKMGEAMDSFSSEKRKRKKWLQNEEFFKQTNIQKK